MLPPILLTLCVLTATWKLWLGDRAIARGDLLLYFYPLREYASQAIRAGRLPLWNPYTFMGAPFLANSQVGFFYPFNVLLAWLPVEQQVSYNIVLHLLIATLGMYTLAVRGLSMGRLGAFCAALAFGLGGYLGAQVEHLNQLQVLAWLPLAIFAIGGWRQEMIGTLTSSLPSLTRRALTLSVLLSLQILAGHTQSLYISLVTLGSVAMCHLLAYFVAKVQSHRSHLVTLPPYLRACAHHGLLILFACALAAAVCGAQLLPTLELSRESYRSGGLSFGEAAAFSWRPWVIARALLPTYGDPLFPEYIAYFGATGLALALLGVLAGLRGEGKGKREATPPHHSSLSLFPFPLLPLSLTLIGFILALGVVTPVFNVLYKVLPGFNLFRAQARWLIVFSLGLSMLVGYGAQALCARGSIKKNTARLWLLLWLFLIGLLLAGLWVGVRVSPEPEYQTWPARRVLWAWAMGAGVVTVLALGYWRLAAKDLHVNLQSPISNLFCIALITELLSAAQFQPYARAADRQALSSLRPSTAHLLAQSQSPSGQGEGSGRILALSGLFFDPGDLPEQTLIYQHQLSADELYDRVIASKHKEILSPNLSLYYRLPSVDGYDGGLLPTRRFVEFASQFTPTPKTGALDGRLREFLRGVPENKWLAQMGVRYLIADKTADIFVDGVYYDTLFQQPLQGEYAVALAPYTATALGLVFSAPSPWPVSAGAGAAHARVQFVDGATREFDLRIVQNVANGFASARASWEEPAVPVTLTLVGNGAIPGLTLRAITSIDATDQSFFWQMVRGEHDMRVAHSGDVKIYENLRPVPRAQLVRSAAQLVRSAAQLPHGTAQITTDLPERVFIELSNTDNAPTQLVLRDACYPGWVAQVDGVATPITCTDILFRQINLPAGARQVLFSYEPHSVCIGFIISGIGIFAWLALLVIVRRQSSIVNQITSRAQ